MTFQLGRRLITNSEDSLVETIVFVGKDVNTTRTRIITIDNNGNHHGYDFVNNCLYYLSIDRALVFREFSVE